MERHIDPRYARVPFESMNGRTDIDEQEQKSCLTKNTTCQCGIIMKHDELGQERACATVTAALNDKEKFQRKME